MSDNDPRYKIDNSEIKELLRDIGNMLKNSMPKGWGFALQMFEFKGESFFYTSNGKREDMIKVLREFINREQ